MNALFAPFAPDAGGQPLAGLVVRPGTPDDLPATAELAAQRECGDVAEWVAVHGRRLADERQRLFVAEFEGGIVGYAWASWLTPVDDGGRGAPDGWYLSGIVVVPALRRRGIGRRLTQARVAWALERNDDIYYVVSASNRASRTLHAALGFREISTDFVLPGVVFANADGILCRLDKRPDADVIDLASRR
ncbi:MAG: GNAT family N-acetyltransferase [Propioniciclava sp.]|uniref:GNAT family N-acetyltransferase n=1 Tax=Propioniciclava sp. TaxID=2038686 RepID=UPI0039E36CC6